MRAAERSRKLAFSRLENDAELMARMRAAKDLPVKWSAESLQDYADRINFPRRIVWDAGPG